MATNCFTQQCQAVPWAAWCGGAACILPGMTRHGSFTQLRYLSLYAQRDATKLAAILWREASQVRSGSLIYLIGRAAQ
ncbi:MAG: hypothetical protein WCA96_05050 [Methylocella sp.]